MPLPFLRSEEVVPIRLWIHRDASHTTFRLLGQYQCIQFRDLGFNTSLLQRQYVNEVKLCDDLQRRLLFVKNQLSENNVTLPSEPPSPSISIPLHLIDQELLDFESRLAQLLEHDSALHDQLSLYKDHHLVVSSIGHLLQSQHSSASIELSTVLDTAREPLLSSPSLSGFASTTFSSLGLLAGVFATNKTRDILKSLWRATRGNHYLKLVTLAENKTCFVGFYSGEVVRLKMTKILEAFGVEIFHLPHSDDVRRDQMNDLKIKIQDLERILHQSSVHKGMILNEASSKVCVWSYVINREKAIYHALNLANYDTSTDFVVAEGWAVKTSLATITNVLSEGSSCSGISVPASFIEELDSINENPPTVFNTGKVFDIFQAITNSYGLPKYGEVNPALFSLVTFPFLFAMMFGDVGHGILLCLIALWFVHKEKVNEKKQLGDIAQYLHSGRYILLFMGVLSIFTGFIYNDFFSLSMHLFKSGYDCSSGRCIQTGVYAFGFDYHWKEASNELLFYNSFKMKFSIVLGVLQMVLGLFLSLLNHLHFKNTINVIGRFVPEFLMLTSIFGYLVFTMYLKWFSTWDNTFHTPSLVHVLINMFLSPKELTPDEYQLFRGQLRVQQLLLGLFIASIFWLLLAKPLFYLKKSSKTYLSVSDSETPDPVSIADVVVGQVIHTIEFVLGCISNTASYLRIWALSLSHAALSAVFFDMLLVKSIQSGNVIVVCLGFATWTAATLGVLVIMEALSAFLHALRLHWVEFQNKFFDGTGTPFKPFSTNL
ncbi:hypothetical protein P9112_012358 [Eukaryota sp. TZLM1-RC]